MFNGTGLEPSIVCAAAASAILTSSSDVQFVNIPNTIPATKASPVPVTSITRVDSEGRGVNSCLL